MKKLTQILVVAVAVFSLLLVPLTPAYAVKSIKDAEKETGQEACQQQGGSYADGKCSKDTPLTGVFRTVANILLFLVGAVAVIMLIIGGFRYVASNGDAGATKGAKDTILYAIIGIIVAFMAYAIVDFVIRQLSIGTK